MKKSTLFCIGLISMISLSACGMITGIAITNNMKELHLKKCREK